MNAAKVIKIGYWSNSIMNGAVLNVGGYPGLSCAERTADAPR